MSNAQLHRDDQGSAAVVLLCVLGDHHSYDMPPGPIPVAREPGAGAEPLRVAGQLRNTSVAESRHGAP